MVMRWVLLVLLLTACGGASSPGSPALPEPAGAEPVAPDAGQPGAGDRGPEDMGEMRMVQPLLNDVDTMK